MSDFYKIFFFHLLYIPFLISCNKNEESVGRSVLDATDEVVVYADTFSIRSSCEFCPNIYSIPDSLMLGELQTEYGTLKCNIFTQFACPIGFSYPNNAIVDSAFINIYYNSFFGNGNAPLYISAHIIDKNSLSYVRTYKTDISVNDYCSFDDSTYVFCEDFLVLASQKIDSVAYTNNSSTIYIKRLKIKLNDHATQRLFNCRDFSSQEAFQKQFKGLYLSTTFGNATLLNVLSTDLNIYYHFHYVSLDGKRDTMVSDFKTFYANSEIKQINNFQILDYEDMKKKVLENGIINITSPIGFYTKLHIPLRYIKERIESTIGIRRPYINKASLKLNILPKVTQNLINSEASPSTFLIMVSDTLINSYFETNTLSSSYDYGVLTKGINANGDTTQYYSLRLDDFLTHVIRNSADEDTLRLCIVPVEGVLTTLSDKTIILSQIKQKQTLSQMTIFGSLDDSASMVLEVVYSGF